MSILISHDNELKDTQMDGVDVFVSAVNVDRSQEKIFTLGKTVCDPQWVDIDANNHVHRWYGTETPTLTENVATYWCESCGDEHDRTLWSCRWCDADVVPGTKTTGPSSVWIEGLVETRISIIGNPGDYTKGQKYLFTSNEFAIEAMCANSSFDSHEPSTYEFLGIGPMLFVDNEGK